MHAHDGFPTKRHVQTAPDDDQLRAGGAGRRLRDVALSLFVQEGFANISLRTLGKHLGVQAGSLYNHLDNKQGLLFELIHEHLEGLVETVEQKVRKFSRAEDKLKAFVSVHLAFQTHERQCAQLMGLELRSLSPTHRSEIDTLLQRYHQCLDTIVRTGIERGVFAPQDLGTSTSSILGMLTSAAFWFNGGTEHSRDRLITHMNTMIMGALGAHR